MPHIYDQDEIDSAIGEIAEFIYQAKVTGVDKRILGLMDVSDTAFNETLNAVHDDLKRIVTEGS